MLKIYLDTNVYSDIAKGVDSEFIKRVYDLAEKEVLFLYSQAHLSDLSSDKTDHKYTELQIIEDLADTNFLQRDANDNQIINSLAKAKEAFKAYGEVYNDNEIFLADSLVKTGDPIFDAYFDSTKSLPIDLGSDIESILSKDDNDSTKVILVRFGITKRRYTLGEWLPVATKLMSSFEKEPEVLKSIRSESKKLLQVDKFNIKIDDVKFDEKLAKSKIGKSFGDLLKEQMEYLQDSLQNFYNEFTTGFNLINFFGFDYEKNKKVRFKSTQNDGQHCYFGGVADIIVSRDEGLLNKSRFMYSYYGIDTRVMSTDDFKSFIKTYQDIVYSNESLFINDLKLKMAKSLILVEKRPIIRHNQNEEIRKLTNSNWGLFNRLSIVKSNTDYDEYIVLYPNVIRSESITFYKDVNYVIRHLNKMLKTNHEFLNEHDKVSIKDGSWKGLVWESEITTYWLRYNFDTGRIGLQVGPLN